MFQSADKKKFSFLKSPALNIFVAIINKLFLIPAFIFIAELLGDLLKNKPTETDGVESVIVVDGIPQVGPDRFEKLIGVINKIFSKMGTIVNEYYPKTEAGVTKG